MRALIVEDEPMARARLARTLAAHFTDIEVVAMTESVRSTVEWLQENTDPDVIFMDVELSDGDCFEIFRQVPVRSKVIMTTAYDSYAIKAFETGSVDYLLKPVDLKSLCRAVERCRERASVIDVEKLLAAMGRDTSRKRYKERYIVKCGGKIIPVQMENVAFFFSQDKSNYMMLLKGEKYIIDSTMDTLEDELDPDRFFRVSRGCIVSRSSVVSVDNNANGKLYLQCSPKAPFEVPVSRNRAKDFLEWLEL